MIISASRRTDIPAFYAEWFANRLNEGFCLVSNPFNKSAVARLSLAREDVDAFVFWTKNPAPFVDKLRALDDAGYPYYFLYTVNDYPEVLEPMVPPLESRIRVFRTLANRIGRGRMVWRYDPVVLSSEFNVGYHKDRFAELARQLSVSTGRVIVSFVDFYRKTERRVSAVERKSGDSFARDPLSVPDVQDLVSDMCEAARRSGMQIQSCAEDGRLAAMGVSAGKCIDDGLLRREFGIEAAGRKDPGQREACSCVVARDMGAPNTCLHGCTYCYATVSPEAARSRHRAHNPSGPGLVPTEMLRGAGQHA